MNLGWQLRVGIRTQDCIPGAPPQSRLECEGPFCSSHLQGEGYRAGSKSTLLQQVPPHLQSHPLPGTQSPLTALERKKFKSLVFNSSPYTVEWVSPTSHSYRSQVPPTPKLQIDLSSCVTLAVCSLSPPPSCLFSDKDQMFFFTSSGLCVSEWTLGGNY